MKKIILSISILLVLLIGSAIFLPYLFKDQIISVVKKEANKSLKAELDFSDDLGINIFKSFPNLNIAFNELTLISKDTTYQNDTVLSADRVSVTFDLMKFYNEQRLLFKAIKLEKPAIHLEFLNDSSYNWNITESEESPSTSSSESLNFELEDVEIENGFFEYTDIASDMLVKFRDIQHKSSGNFNTENFKLDSKSEIGEALILMEDMAYVHHWKLKQAGVIDVNLAQSKYNFPKNTLSINGLDATLNGSVELGEEDMIFDIETTSASPDLNKFLTLIPAIYTTDFESIETKGSGKLQAYFKGIMNDKEFPSYDLKLQVKDGWFKYPELDLPAEDINVDLHVYSKSGNTDRTVIDIPQMNFKLAGDPFDVKLNMQDLAGDPLINSEAKGTLNLSNIQKLIPLEDIELSGVLTSDLSIIGRVNDISNSAIDKFTANGSANIANLSYKSSNMNEQLDVHNAQISVKNQRVSIPTFDGNLGENDINFSGYFDNFFSYALSDQTLTGKATLTSKRLNTNDFQTTTTLDGEETEMTLVEVPGNVDLDFTTAIGKLVYDDLELDDFTGNFRVQNQTLQMNDISTRLLGGRLNLKGAYEYDITKPLANFDISYSDIKIADLLSKFKIIKAFAPITSQVNALTTAKFNFSSELNDDMSPKLSNINMGGSLNLQNIVVDKLNVLKSLDTKLGTNHFNVEKLKDFFLNFNIKDGQLLVSPFDIFIDSSKLTLNGLSKLDGSIAYDGFLSIPSTYIKNETSVLNNLIAGSSFKDVELKPNDFLNLAIKIGGTFKKPELNLNLKEINSSLKENIKNKLASELEKKKQEATKTATNEVNKIKQETETKAKEAKAKLEAELRKKQQETEERLRKEADAKKQELKDAAKKKLGDLFKK